MHKKVINNQEHFSLLPKEIKFLANKLENLLDKDKINIKLFNDKQNISKYFSSKISKIVVKKKFIENVNNTKNLDLIFFNPFELENKYICKNEWVKIYIDDISLEKNINYWIKNKTCKGVGLLLPKNYNIGFFLSFIYSCNINIIKLSKFYLVLINFENNI